MTVVIGLTGGIGSGKSTLSKLFLAHQVVIIDADAIARLVVQKDQPVLAEISAYFGPEILINGQLNRPLLRRIIFSDENKKAYLNALLHPLIRTEMLLQLQHARGDYVIFEAPLLFENNLDVFCDHCLVVDVDEEIQLQRVSARDNTDIATIKAIIASQIGREARLSRADFVINNSTASLTQLKDEVTKLDHKFRSFSI
ncbi:dephospho-CoA kinase [Psychromonas sp. CNPT3]|uniref:dephospho-CoA kinase n=1 Tax=Psychromonas sp. CNPT3 TaxID=314282 RepID=UPI00006E42BC|nr:dephospho-CoA kinase [Psychromonas sp. CNPT3]AGH80653.1 dephospho-CoA kinase [Psychromonas sp. CNPT3]